jgi:hypothetical protein
MISLSSADLLAIVGAQRIDHLFEQRNAYPLSACLWGRPADSLEPVAASHELVDYGLAADWLSHLSAGVAEIN